MEPVFPRVLLAASLSCVPASAALYMGPAQGGWNDNANWDTGAVPATRYGEDASISNGATVDYPAGILSDLIVAAAGTLKISNGSILKTETTHWTQVNGGTLLLDGGHLVRGTTGNFVAGFTAGTEEMPLVSTVTLKNGASISMTTPGTTNFFLSFADNTASVLNLENSALLLGGEIWMGRDITSDFNQTAGINLYNSSITTGGAVGLWIWDFAAPGNSFRINFTGPAGSFIDAADSIGTQDNGVRNNAATWRMLWDLGILTAQGQSGVTGAEFGDHFVTEGTNERDGLPYRLTLIPESSSLSVLAAAGVGLLLPRRRRRAVS